ncbi:TlpA family protein disulfide reductase [Winogradskyella immobilis]|uniref:TlpA family protein disulfide reductase n=1 Tax=Winogradskyella immobilis TaxID=2816852 RepID=A0ABS8ELM3_9FLAO|nr:TlpA disulfide reductase family protein [Winogradskyella immobilis]MCC1484114.1 TlpA family protein disulfide reductase [Winogradskyella immobilis]MCG0016206.1 TlpA family protein disulfide reductase [Winogradskyella immobilis]
MKRLLVILILIIGITLQNIEAQSIKIDNTTIIKDADGKKIDYDTFSKMMQSGDWTISQQKDSDGNNYIQLEKASPETKKRMEAFRARQLRTSNLEGKSATPFEMTDMEGNTITTESTKGKVVVLNFWFIACKPCIAEIPELNEIHEKYKDNKDIVFASITFDRKSKVEKFLKDTPIYYPVVPYQRTTISRFGVSSYPTNMVIGKDGKISDAISGRFLGVGLHIENAIETALKGK